MIIALLIVVIILLILAIRILFNIGMRLHNGVKINLDEEDSKDDIFKEVQEEIYLN
jgi:hypothetical protein